MTSLIYSLVLLFNHAYHVSVCEINQNSKKNSLQITHKVFIDDLEKAIEQGQKTKLLLGNVNQNKQAKAIIGKYIENHFSLLKDGKSIDLVYLGYELDTDQVFIYFEGKAIGKYKNLRVKYNPLTEVYEDQANMVHVKFDLLKTSLFLNASKQEANIEF